MARGDMFQSTPPRGRRRKDGGGLMKMESFNPRLREGGDEPCDDDLPQGIYVSIHASAREATWAGVD